MRSLGVFVRALAPLALLIGPVLASFNLHHPGRSIVGICMGIGLSATYAVLEQIAEGVRAKKSEQ